MAGGIVDVFCGVGGLGSGFARAGFVLRGGFDVERSCKEAYEENEPEAEFRCRDVTELKGCEVLSMYEPGEMKILVGSAPCQPFSRLKREEDARKNLLNQFARLVKEVEPDIVASENVPSLRMYPVWKRFVNALRRQGYKPYVHVLDAGDYGVPQRRRRLVLVASKFGEPHTPRTVSPSPTVREAIAHLPPVRAGEKNSEDALHRSRNLSDTNLERLENSVPGGTWLDWPEHLRLPCHQRILEKQDGKTGYGDVYGRMDWDKPSPTITTKFTQLSTGRYGHPEQHRALTIREGALLQGFDRDFGLPELALDVQARLIGNAVPPPLAHAMGKAARATFA